MKNHQISNIGHTFLGNKIVYHSDVAGAAPTGRRCSNYIFIIDLASGFNRLCKNCCKTRRETFKLWEVVPLILETWWYVSFTENIKLPCISVMKWLWHEGHQPSGITLTHFSPWSPRWLVVDGDNLLSSEIWKQFFINVKICMLCPHTLFNSLRRRWSRLHFADDSFKCIFLNENLD